jgi:hypothetical protein
MTVLDHIAEHVHAFSLRALPWAPDVVHETEAGIQKAAAKVEPWLTMHNLTSQTLTAIEFSTQTPASSSPVTHYFNTHDYFAEDSENSSCSTASDGTIERELREGQSPVYGEVFVESDYETDDVESDGATDGSNEEGDVAQPFNEDDFVVSADGSHIVEKSDIADEGRLSFGDAYDDDESDEGNAITEEIDIPVPMHEYSDVSRYVFLQLTPISKRWCLIAMEQ